MANKDFNVEIGKSNKEFYPLDKDLVTDTQRGVPKGTPRETLKKLGKYSKNVIVSAGKLTADVTGSFIPNTTAFAQSMTDVVKLASDEAKAKLLKLREFVNKKKSVDTGPKQTMDDFVKSMSTTKRDIIDRVKSGEFYKTDSENIDMSGMFNDADFNFDDFGSDIDLGGSTKFGDPETTLSAEPFGESTTTINSSKSGGHSQHDLSRNAFSGPTVINMGASSSKGVSLGEELVSNITSDVGKAIISQQNELFDKNFAIAEMRFVQHMEVQKGILQAVNATVNHLQNVEGVSSSAAMEFQGKMIGMQQEQLNLLKEIKEASIISITPPSANNRTGSQSTTERVLNNGQINAEEYWKNIKSNMNNELLRSSLGPIYSMLPMLSMMDMGSDMGIKQKADPMSSLLKGILSSSLSMKTKAKLSNFNDMLRDSGSLFIGKMNDLAANSDNKLLQTLGRVLGTKDAYVKQGDYGLKDPDKVVGWSAKSDRTLNEVIPTRLSEIVSALTGKEQTFYDYKTGTFVTKTEKNREYQNVRRQAFSDYELDSITGNMANKAAISKGKGLDKQFVASLNKDFQTIRMNIGKTNRTFNVEAAKSNKQYRSELLKGISNEESLDLFIESFGQMSQNDAVRFNGRTLTVNTTGSKRLQQFSDDALKYGGAGVSSEIQNMDEADALEHRLKNSYRYSKEYLATLDNTPSGKAAKASILREKADIMANIRKLRSNGQSSGNQFVANSIINDGGSMSQIQTANEYQSAVRSAEDSGYITEGNTGNAQNNIYNTLSNMFNLLVNGILVYPQKTDNIPSHITAARKFMSSNAKMSNLAKELDNFKYSDLDKAQLEAIQSTNESARLRQLTSQFGPFATMSQIFGLSNEDKKDNNIINKGFNKIYNFTMGKAGVLFGNGNSDISADNDNVNNAYTEYISKERNEVIKSLNKAIANTEKALSKENASKASISFNKKKLDFLNKALKQVENGGSLAPEVMAKVKEETAPLVSSLKANVTKAKTTVTGFAKNKYDKLDKDSKIKKGIDAFVDTGKAVYDNTKAGFDATVIAGKVASNTIKVIKDMGMDPKETMSKDNIVAALELGAIDTGEFTPDEAKAYAEDVSAKFSGKNVKSVLSSLRNTAKTNVTKAKTSVIGFAKNKYDKLGEDSKIKKIIDSTVNTSKTVYDNAKTDFDSVMLAGKVASNTIKVIKDMGMDPKETMSKDNIVAALELGAIDTGEFTPDEAKAYAEDVSAKFSGKNVKSVLSSLRNTAKTNVTKAKAKGKKLKDNISKSGAKAFEDASGALSSAGEVISEKAGNFVDTVKDAFSQLGLGDKFNKFADKLGTFGTFVTKGPIAAAKRVGGKALSNALSFDSLDDLKGKVVGKIFSSKEVRSKDEILEERKAIQATYAAIDSIEQWCSENLEPNDMKADKTINKMINEQVKSGAMDKAIGQMLKDGIANLKAKGYPPIMALSKVKEAIRAKYDKSFKKEMSAHNPFLKVAKSVGKWSGTIAGSTLLLASGNPLLAVALVGNSLRTNPAFQKFIKNKTDKKSVVHKLNSSLKNKAVGKYGVELSPFDALLGISPMSKLTDKELENEQKIAAATFTALDEIEKIANETIDPTDKKAGDKVIKMIKAAMKKGPIDKDIGNMIIERITSKVQEGKSPIEALSEAKTTIQKNYSKIFKKESKRRSPGRKILRGFGKGLGIAAVAMYNPLLAAAMLGREILKGKRAKKDKEAGSDRDEINSILGKDALNEKQKKPAGDGFFSRMKDKFTDTATSVKENIQSKFKGSKDKDKAKEKEDSKDKVPKESTPSEQKEKGTGIFAKAKNTVTDVFTGLREGSFSDYKADKKAKEKEDREKKQIDLFASISGTLTSIKKGLGIFDKGEIDEKDGETFAGKLEEIAGATKATSMATGATAEKSSPGFLGNLGKFLVKAGNVVPKVATGLAVAGVAITTAAAVHNAAKGVKRWKEEGAAAGVGQLTGLDKSADSDFNADGTRKQADFHIGGENGFDVDIDRGTERAPAKRQLLNVKSHVKAIRNAGDKVGNGLKNLGNKLIKKGGGEAVETAAKAADSIPPKFITKITDGLKKFFTSKKVSKYIKPEKAKEIITKLTSRFKNSSLFKKISAKAGGKSLMKQIPGFGMAMTAVGAAVDFINGMSKTNRYFKISKNDTATLGMKIAAGLAESLPGLVGAIPGIGLFAGIAAAMIPPEWLAENLYKLFASEKEEAELAAKQEAFQKKAEELGVDPDRLNEYENKSLGQKIVGVFKSQKKKDLENARLLGFGDDVDAYKEWEKKYKGQGKDGGTEASSMVEDKAVEAETSIQGTVPEEKASEIKAAVAAGSTATTASETAVSKTATITPTLASTKQQKVEEKKPENLSVNPTSTTEAKRKTSLSGVGKMVFKATPVGMAVTAVGAVGKGVKKVGKNIVSRIKESPFVTNDKLLMQQLKETLNVQKEIRDEMFRHNETVENFINYMLNYYRKVQDKQKKVDQDKMLKEYGEKKAGWFASLFSDKSDSNADDVEFRNDMDIIATGV